MLSFGERERRADLTPKGRKNWTKDIQRFQKQCAVLLISQEEALCRSCCAQAVDLDLGSVAPVHGRGGVSLDSETECITAKTNVSVCASYSPFSLVGV